MKILYLKFKNINSLWGENEIDFTNPIFTNDGLFAITGKTGAGKSSILDAISLAFYGKTPRVDITGNENAVMTRGEKDCYAEITFEISGNIWKSSWKQERSKNGNLKPIQRIIADSNNKIIADQIRTCNDTIIDILGLTFEQFTKVIMLAQGSFAAFLQANKDEKSTLLEQITGTDIYSDISINVYERSKEERDKYNNILTELQAIKTISEDDIIDLKNINLTLEKEKKQIESELEKLEIAQKWLIDIAILQTGIKEAKSKLPQLEENTRKAKEAFEQSEINLKNAKDSFDKQMPIFKSVRELDTKISEKKKLLKPILIEIDKLNKDIHIVNNLLNNENNKLDKSHKLFLEKKNWLNNNKIYEELVLNYSAIENDYRLLFDSSVEIKKLDSELKALQKEVDLKKSTYKEAKNNLNEKNDKLSAKIKDLDINKSEKTQILNGKDILQLESDKAKITNIGTYIKNLINIEKDIQSSKNEIKSINQNLDNFELLSNSIAETINQSKEFKIFIEKQIYLLDENIKRANIIQSLDEHRKNLKDGEECPLCGSREHPYAIGNIPQIGEQETEMADLKNQLLRTTEIIQQNEKKIASLISNKENDLKNRQKEERLLTENMEKNKSFLSEIKRIDSASVFPKKGDIIEQLNDILNQKREVFVMLKGLIEKIKSIDSRIYDIQEIEIPKLQNEKQDAEKNVNEADIACKLAEQQYYDKQNLFKNKEEVFQKNNANFTAKLKIYSVTNIDDLKKCLDDWLQNKKLLEDLTNQLKEIENNIVIKNNELENYRKLLENKEKEKKNIEVEENNLLQQRKNIFGEKSVDIEEIHLNKLIEDYTTKKSESQNTYIQTDKEFEKVKAVVSEKEKQLADKLKLQITNKSTAELKAEYEEKKFRIDEISQKIGANNQILIYNEENIKNSDIKKREKVKQFKVYNKWAKLNDLIGSGDGKKYRNFAQALTFEYLVGLSNEQLKKMSDRYLLKRIGDSSNPFELYVIDKYQNSEERTAQNLSGGEKFIVSLSLALGLSGMASKNMRIDTMFIDEGFGTLDSDYLDVALNALSNLQSEGKIIGVISHLAELKERIATHVEVIPSGNGHSKIQITH
ncbi:MAG: AAA family ATPase [Bacteroidetes bacterium]|nr:AAA family ATPase [Bacteroidota bacterium]